jgi:hypothetical protein
MGACISFLVANRSPGRAQGAVATPLGWVHPDCKRGSVVLPSLSDNFDAMT